MQLLSTILDFLTVFATIAVCIGMYVLRKTSSLIGTVIIFISMSIIFLCYLLDSIFIIVFLNTIPLEAIALTTILGIFVAIEFCFLSREIKDKDIDK